MVLGYIIGVIGLFGVAFGIGCYAELRKWAYQCKYARIVVAYKGKVKLNYPIEEWVIMTNLLDKDKDANGRTIYKLGGTDIAIIKKSFVPKSRFTRFVTRSYRKPNPQTKTGAVQGTWGTTEVGGKNARTISR